MAGENWTLAATEVDYAALWIDELTASEGRMIGGKFRNVGLAICIRASVKDESGVKDGSIIVARGSRVLVNEIVADGSDSFTLNCGPVTASIPR